MRQFLFAVLMLSVAMGVAGAAERPAPFDWSGFHAGVHGGGGWGQSHHSTATFPDFSGNFTVGGGLIGITAGYNWQFGSVVAGIEGDASFSSIRGSTAGIAPVFCPDGGPQSDCTTKLKGVETLRLRVGYARDRLLPFMTGGLAVGQIYGASDPGHANSGMKSKAAVAFGGGVEAALTGNITAKVEYLYIDFGTVNNLFTRNPGPFPFDVSLNTNIVRVGVNYKFD